MELWSSIALGCSAAALAFGAFAVIWSTAQKKAVAGLAQAMHSAGNGLEHLNSQLEAQQRALSRAQARLRHCQRRIRDLRDAAAVRSSSTASPAPDSLVPLGEETSEDAPTGMPRPINQSEAQLLEMMQQSTAAPRAA